MSPSSKENIKSMCKLNRYSVQTFAINRYKSKPKINLSHDLRYNESSMNILQKYRSRASKQLYTMWHGLELILYLQINSGSQVAVPRDTSSLKRKIPKVPIRDSYVILYCIRNKRLWGKEVSEKRETSESSG